MPNPLKAAIHKIRSPSSSGSRSPNAEKDLGSTSVRPSVERSHSDDSGALASVSSAPAATLPKNQAQSPDTAGSKGGSVKGHAEDLRHRLAHLVPHPSRASHDLNRSGSRSPSETRSDHEGATSPSSRRSIDLFRHKSIGHGPSLTSKLHPTGSKDSRQRKSGGVRSGSSTPKDTGEPSERTKQKEAARAERLRRQQEEAEKQEQLKKEAHEAVSDHSACAFPRTYFTA